MAADAFGVIQDAAQHLGGKRNWMQWAPLTFEAKGNPTYAASLLEGRVAHLNAAGLFEPGVGNRHVGMFLHRGMSGLDVATGAHNSYGGAGVPGGTMAAVVALGGYELETTEFDATSNYAPNDVLTSPTTTTAATATELGRVYKVKNWSGGAGAAITPYVDPIVGVASWGQTAAGFSAATSPAYRNSYNVNVLAFWPVYLPVA